MIDPKVRVQKSSSPSTQATRSAEPETSTKKERSNVVSEQEVRDYAYELYERRDSTEDHAVEDWLTAEAYLSERPNRAPQAIAG